MQKEKELKKLAEIEGHEIERHQIPDYIDPQFAKEKRLYPVQDNQDINDNYPKKKERKKSDKKTLESIGSTNKKKKK